MEQDSRLSDSLAFPVCQESVSFLLPCRAAARTKESQDPLCSRICRPGDRRHSTDPQATEGTGLPAPRREASGWAAALRGGRDASPCSRLPQPEGSPSPVPCPQPAPRPHRSILTSALRLHGDCLPRPTPGAGSGIPAPAPGLPLPSFRARGLRRTRSQPSSSLGRASSPTRTKPESDR